MAIITIVNDGKRLRAKADDGIHGSHWCQFPNYLRDSAGVQYEIPDKDLKWNPERGFYNAMGAKEYKLYSEEPKEKEITLTMVNDTVGYEAPDYRGASYPPFNEFAINESEIPDCTRAKDGNFDVDEDRNYINIYWITQEPFDDDDAKAVEQEIKRAYTAVANKLGYKDSFEIQFTLEARDGHAYGYYHNVFNIIPHEAEESKVKPRSKAKKFDLSRFEGLDLTDDLDEIINEEFIFDTDDNVSNYFGI